MTDEKEILPEEQRYLVLENRLNCIMARDISQVVAKDREYGSSWKLRGGVGAFMMLARKWDRIENRVRQADASFQMDGGRTPSKYDIFEHIEADGREEGLLDDIRDLRNYLLLVEEEMMHRGVLEDVLVERGKRRGHALFEEPIDDHFEKQS